MNKSEVIRDLYHEEAEKGRQESETIQLTIQLGAESKFLLEALSERFRVSQSSIARPLLEDALETAFLSLNAQDRKTVSENADKKTKDFLVKTYQEQGGSYEHHGLGRWAAVAYCDDCNNQPDQDEAA